MLKYCWIIMLAVIWIIWLIATVVDVINTYRRVGSCFDLLDELDNSSRAFIVITLTIIFVVSFISWLINVN